MCKAIIKLTLVEMHAIKHALQKQIQIKNKRLESICTSSASDWDHTMEEEFDRLTKDIPHEIELVKRLEIEIETLKEKHKIGR